MNAKLVNRTGKFSFFFFILFSDSPPPHLASPLLLKNIFSYVRLLFILQARGIMLKLFPWTRYDIKINYESMIRDNKEKIKFFYIIFKLIQIWDSFLFFHLLTIPVFLPRFSETFSFLGVFFFLIFFFSLRTPSR